VPTPRGPLPEEEYQRIYSRVPRLTVGVVIAEAGRVLLTLRETGRCKGLWHIPGGTVRFGERLSDAVGRVARKELGVEVAVGALIDVIEYPSHYEHGLGLPVGLAFWATPTTGDLAVVTHGGGSRERPRTCTTSSGRSSTGTSCPPAVREAVRRQRRRPVLVDRNFTAAGPNDLGCSRHALWRC
jgi:ADP-ribose pyrophosphatase YjhB (NUDIX family)